MPICTCGVGYPSFSSFFSSSSVFFSSSSISFSISSIGAGGGVVARVYPIQASIPNTPTIAADPVSLRRSIAYFVRNSPYRYATIIMTEPMRIIDPIAWSLLILIMPFHCCKLINFGFCSAAFNRWFGLGVACFVVLGLFFRF